VLGSGARLATFEPAPHLVGRMSVLDTRREDAGEMNGFSCSVPASASAAFTDFVIPNLDAWQERGLRNALVTLVAIDGAAPRPLGAQMAVAETGEWAGYISGGCLEQALVAEAQRAMAQRENRLVRYGAGSPYFDIRLPCGSGLELYVDQAVPRALVRRMSGLASRRQPFALQLDMDRGHSALLPQAANGKAPATSRDGGLFTRVYQPPLRCVIIGAGPIAISTALLAQNAGLALSFYTPEAELARSLFRGAAEVHPMTGVPPGIETDERTAVLLSFHDHDLEIPLLDDLLRAPAFFIAAIGSKRAHEQRKAALRALGLAEEAIARIRGPAGLIKGVKSAPVLAVSMLAEMLAEAQARGFV
jgi:xanthine dehydrogenase accessory factor